MYPIMKIDFEPETWSINNEIAGRHIMVLSRCENVNNAVASDIVARNAK